MAMGRLSNRRGGAARPSSQLAVALAPRHFFYDRCTEILAEAEFDATVEMLCQPYYTDGIGRPSIPPGRYFRRLFVGQFEGLESEREIAWRCADSLSLHRFLRLQDGETVPDHSTLSVTRARLPLEHVVFGFILEIADQHDLVRGKRIGVDASTQKLFVCARRSWGDPAGGSPVREGGSARPVASVAGSSATMVLKRTQRDDEDCIELRKLLTVEAVLHGGGRGKGAPTPSVNYATRTESGRPRSSIRLRTWAAMATSVTRASSLWKRSPSPMTCFQRANCAFHKNYYVVGFRCAGR